MVWARAHCTVCVCTVVRTVLFRMFFFLFCSLPIVCIWVKCAFITWTVLAALCVQLQFTMSKHHGTSYREKILSELLWTQISVNFHEIGRKRGQERVSERTRKNEKKTMAHISNEIPLSSGPWLWQTNEINKIYVSCSWFKCWIFLNMCAYFVLHLFFWFLACVHDAMNNKLFDWLCRTVPSLRCNLRWMANHLVVHENVVPKTDITTRNDEEDREKKRCIKLKRIRKISL